MADKTDSKTKVAPFATWHSAIRFFSSASIVATCLYVIFLSIWAHQGKYADRYGVTDWSGFIYPLMLLPFVLAPNIFCMYAAKPRRVADPKHHEPRTKNATRNMASLFFKASVYLIFVATMIIDAWVLLFVVAFFLKNLIPS